MNYMIYCRFMKILLEPHSNCELDYVSVYNGDRIEATSLLGRFCDSASPPIVTSGTNKMLVRFVSDASIGFEGFSARYTHVYGNIFCLLADSCENTVIMLKILLFMETLFSARIRFPFRVIAVLACSRRLSRSIVTCFIN